MEPVGPRYIAPAETAALPVVLRGGSVGFYGLVAQSVASIGPSLVIAVLISQVAAASGAAAWLTWTISTVIIVAVTFCITELTERFVTTGGLYVLNAQASSGLGVITAWAALLFGIGSAPILPLAFAVYLTDFLTSFGITNGGPVTLLLAIALCTIFAALLSWRDVGISAAAMLAIELISLVSIVTLMIIVAAHHMDALLDASQLRLPGTSMQRIAGGVVLSLLAFAGFESSCYLGRETTHPRQAISRSMKVSVVVCGALFVFCTYIMTVGLRSSGLAQSGNPLRELAQESGVGFLIDIVQPGVIISCFGLTIASLNGASRLLMTLSREGMLPSRLAWIDPQTRTPAVAILLVALVNIGTGIILVATRSATLVTYGTIGTVAGYCIGVTYMLACVAMVIILWRQRALRLWHLSFSIFGIGCFAAFYYASAVPLPPPPQDLLLYIFAGGMILALGHLTVLIASRSPLLQRLGVSTLDDIKVVRSGVELTPERLGAPEREVAP